MIKEKINLFREKVKLLQTVKQVGVRLQASRPLFLASGLAFLIALTLVGISTFWYLKKWVNLR